MKKLIHASLLCDSAAVFPASEAYLRRGRDESNPNSDGVRAGGFHEFSGYLKREKRQVEERFSNQA